MEMSELHQLNLRRCQPSEARDVVSWIKQNHYLRSAPPGFVAVLEYFLDDPHERVGAIQIGRPAARSLDADRVLEITRVYFVDQTPKNTESKALSMMRAFIRHWYPKVKQTTNRQEMEV